MGAISKLLGAGLKKATSKRAVESTNAKYYREQIKDLEERVASFKKGFAENEFGPGKTMTKTGARERLDIHSVNLKKMQAALNRELNRDVRTSRSTLKGLGGPKKKQMATKGSKITQKSKKKTAAKSSKTQSTDYKKYLTTDKATEKKYEAGSKASKMIKSGVDKLKKKKGQASKSTTKKLLKSQAKRRKEAEPTAKELLDQMKEMDIFKRQAD